MIILMINCKEEKEQNLSTISSKISISQTNKSNNLDFNSIDELSIGKEVSNSLKEKLIIQYKKALEKDFERPYMWDAFLTENENLINFHTYKSYIINNKKFESYCIKIKYEDAKYEAILLTSSDLNEKNSENLSIVVFEDLNSEELYSRTSKIIDNNILNITLFKNKREYQKLRYLVMENMFIDYFPKVNEKINKNWGKKEENTYAYQIKGEIKNHLKNGHWEERRYSFEGNKSVWMDGEYKNGIRNGEWNISPNGPVEKVYIYNNGSIIKTFYP